LAEVNNCFQFAKKMIKTSIQAKGELIADLLSGAWRQTPSVPGLSADELECITPLLLQSGAGGLAWWRLQTAGWESDAVTELHQAYRLYTLGARLNKARIEKVVTLLRSAGIEPILVKGWTAARHYPQPGLRPYGDIDVCVRRCDYETAEQSLRVLDSPEIEVDLHRGFQKLGALREEELFARSQLVKLDQVDVRILSAEDQLHTICFHLMREGAWRPLWLADVAVALESRPANFDWTYCLSERGEVTAAAIALAHLLLGADIDDVPDAARLANIPRWLVPAVLNEWGAPKPSMLGRHTMPMKRYVRRLRDLPDGLRDRWPNAIEATTMMNGGFNEFPRLPLQIGLEIFRGGAFCASMAIKVVKRSR
jgi:hypothetical protein